MTHVALLLPERSRLAGHPLPEPLARVLARADREFRAPGRKEQLRRHFRWLPERCPFAALTRQWEAGDAGQDAWLRADPVHVAPDINGARLLAHADALGLTDADAASLLTALKPLFGDAGFALDAPHPTRWYLRLAASAPLPDFTDLEDVLGNNLLDYLPRGDDASTARWHALLNEAQIILHQHPWNQRRAAHGNVTVNSLWFWGGGVFPDRVSSQYREVRSRDPQLLALAHAAGAELNMDEGDKERRITNILIDLRHLRSSGGFIEEVLQPLLQAMRRRELDAITLDFEDGACFFLRPGQRRWHFWLSPLRSLDA